MKETKFRRLRRDELMDDAGAMEALARASVALLAHPGALCVFFPAGESLRDGNVIGGIRSMAKEQGALPLQIWINGRVAAAGQGVRVADVVGLGQLGQMDQEAVFPDRPDLNPFEVLGYLFDVTHHLFNEGGDLEEGVVYEGPGGLRWRASLGQTAQIPPARGIVRWIPLSEGESEGEGEEQELGAHTGTAHDDGAPSHISFKCSDLTFEMLCQERGISPAPYLGRYKWAQLVAGHPLTNDDVQAYIKASYDMVAAKLTKAKRKEIGLI